MYAINKFLTALLLTTLAIGSLSACAQSVDDARKARILGNLKHEFPQLREYEVEMRALESTAIPGVERGSFVIAGQQTQEFIITEDDQLYLIAAGPIDVGRTEADLAALREEERAAENAQARKRHAELIAFAEGQPVRGNPEAPVTIIEFSDFQCPYCRRAAETVEELLAQRSDVNLIYLHFPLSNHPWARPAAIASVCAAQQDDEAFWKLHDAYFEDQRELNVENVLARSKTYLAGSNLDLETWAACAVDEKSSTHAEAAAFVDASMKVGQRFGVSGTPGFFVNGRYVSGAQPMETFEALIEEVTRQ